MHSPSNEDKCGNSTGQILSAPISGATVLGNVVIFQVAVYPAIKHLYLGKMGCSEARLGDHKQSSLQKSEGHKESMMSVPKELT